MSSSQSQSIEEKVKSASPVLPDDMGLEEVMRVMDVASTLRREQELVEREFNVDKTKEVLREKLRRTAEMTGETLTPEQIEAAVDWYYDNLHEYQEPEKSFKWYLAHLYVYRNWILGFAIPIALAAGAIWAFWLAPFAPFSEANKIHRMLVEAKEKIDKKLGTIAARSDELASLQQQIGRIRKQSDTAFETDRLDKLIEIDSKLADMDNTVGALVRSNDQIKKLIPSILAVTKEATVKTEVAELENEAQALFNNLDSEKLRLTQQRLSAIDKRINEEFNIVIMGGGNQQSAVRRDVDDDDLDESQKRVSGYYVIVQARDAKGKVLKRKIQDIETDKFKVVETWGEKVPKAVYDRLRKDKTADGILNETAFGQKVRGELNVRIQMLGSDGQPIKRSVQITSW